ncbi:MULTISPECIES: hypothetical protein [Alphaproteobacteria]|jgi:hypothetical protein|uniref:Circularly permuted type 2 ATP-grasp protein n=3 Tax=Alphaproteobacteria TaxID=28211 RepID=A0A6L6J2C8_9RHOB|nr:MULTISPECIES: hypothetical protein [Paracoccus]KGJ22093.1 hypothetical protein IX56_10120 [Paracoccus sanguinis]MTH64877.1 hypothetical protein [Paracoccus shanxieyensis]MTH87890.1 hypothetical protein [Paracoccus shanxieyensis]
MNNPGSSSSKRVQDRTDRLNKNCFCVTLDLPSLREAMEREAGEPAFFETFIRPKAHLFSHVPVFLSATTVDEMRAIAAAVETTAQLAAYKAAVLSWAPEIARADHGPIGALMGYDFHLGEDGPRLIEINTNAGGAFLNAFLARAQRACCAEMDIPPTLLSFEDAAFRMFQNEWIRQRGTGAPERIAIVDDNPPEQYLYPEFVLARQVLAARGVDAVIADAGHLSYDDGQLSVDGKTIDLVYNRVTDFAFDQPEHKALQESYRDGAVVVTPNPHNHALLADKRNLSLLSNSATLEAWGVDPGIRAGLAAVPRTVLVNPDNADALWKSRKDLFFKPTGGHGGKAVYRGDKLTKGVWAEIAGGGYVAQTLVRPSERMIKIDETPQRRKMDVRLYTYDGQVLLVAARLYQGQTTNFRTLGGGFAPVFVI